MRVDVHLLVSVGIAIAMAGQAVAAGHLQPSDLELTTVYCVGVLKNRLTMLRELSPSQKSAIDAVRRDLERLGEFIAPRLDTLDTAQLATARRRANDDFMAWYADTNACMRACVGERANRDRRRTCWSGCSQTGASFERMRICTTIDWLPS